MRLARLTLVASVGLLLLAASGCYRPYPNSPYGAPYGSPYGTPYQSAPVQTLTPGGTYTPGGLQPSPYGSGVPTESFSQPTPIPSTFEPNSGSGSSAPFYDPNTSSTPYGGGGNGVPQPYDPGEVQFNPTPRQPVADDITIDTFGAVEGVGATTENVAKVSVENSAFVTPVRSSSTLAGPTPTEFAAAGPVTPNPYAYDADDYRWIRGRARLNESTGVWSLIYSLNQLEADKYHGWLTLAPDPLLGQLTIDGAYLISGQLDDEQTDASGKPMYRLQSITPWRPNEETPVE